MHAHKTAKRRKLCVPLTDIISGEVIRCRIFPFLCIRSHMIFGRLSHHLLKLSKCPSPPKNNKVLWNKKVYLKTIDTHVLNRIAETVPTSSLSCWQFSSYDTNPLKHMPQLRQLQFRLADDIMVLNNWPCPENLKFIEKLPLLSELHLRVRGNDECFSILLHLKNLARLSLSCPDIRGPVMSILQELPVLYRLELGVSVSIAAEYFSFIPNFPNLRELVCASTNITDSHIFHLRETKLTELSVPANKLSLIGFSYLENLPLETLDFGLCRRASSRPTFEIDSKVVSTINKLGKTLRNLRVTDAAINAQELCLPHLQTLILVNCSEVNDDGIKHVAKHMKGLCYMKLETCCGVGDASVHALVGLLKLSVLVLVDTSVTPRCMNDLKNIRSLKGFVLKVDHDDDHDYVEIETFGTQLLDKYGKPENLFKSPFMRNAYILNM